jgi:hypothetical protein
VNEITSFRDLLAPTQFAAALWAVGFLIVTAVWLIVFRRRLTALLESMRTDDPDLWRELGTPQNVAAMASLRNRAVFVRLKRDETYAWQFNQRTVARIRGLQREISIMLASLSVAGCFVMFIVWPYRH